MPTATKTKKTARHRRKQPVKATAPKTFGEWAKSVAGMVQSGKGDLSTREGFDS